MPEPFRIGIAGLGTVGVGLVELLQNNAALIHKRAGRELEIVSVSARDRGKNRAVDLTSYEWVDNVMVMADDDRLDAVVELIGGTEGVARGLVSRTLSNGRAVVTANKALLAHHGYELASIAEKNHAPLMCEAAVAGGIPIIKALREGFSANNINAVYGILNGTCNYILTTMRETGQSFEAVLQEAQEKGYAESDPAFDVDGVDAAHKLCLISALAFGVKPEIEQVKTTGITHITAKDILYAQELGYRVKLLGMTRNLRGKIIQTIEPCLVPDEGPMGAVENVFNAVFVEGDFVGDSLSVGRGAGAGPTASAVAADLVDLMRAISVPVFGIPCAAMQEADWGDSGDLTGRFYMHLVVSDKPGVLADVSAIMRDHGVSLEAVAQRGRAPDKPVSIIMSTHKVKQADIQNAARIAADLPMVHTPPCLLRIENI